MSYFSGVVAASVINEVSATYHTTPHTVRLTDQESSVLETRVCSTTELTTVLEVPGKNSIPPATDVVGQTKHDFSDGAPTDAFDPEKPGLPISEAAKSSNAVAEKLTTVVSNGNQQQESVVMETRIPITTIIDDREKDKEKVDKNGTSSNELEKKPVESSQELSKLRVVVDKRKFKSLYYASFQSSKLVVLTI